MMPLPVARNIETANSAVGPDRGIGYIFIPKYRWKGIKVCSVSRKPIFLNVGGRRPGTHSNIDVIYRTFIDLGVPPEQVYFQSAAAANMFTGHSN